MDAVALVLQLDQPLRLTDELVEALLECAQLQLKARDAPAQSIHLSLGPRWWLWRARNFDDFGIVQCSAAGRVHVVKDSDGLRRKCRQVAAEADQDTFRLRRREQAGQSLQPVHGPSHPVQHSLHLQVERVKQARAHGADERFSKGVLSVPGGASSLYSVRPCAAYSSAVLELAALCCR